MKILLFFLAFGLIIPYFDVLLFLSIPNIILLILGIIYTVGNINSINKHLWYLSVINISLLTISFIRTGSFFHLVESYLWPIIIIFGTYCFMKNKSLFFYFNNWFVFFIALSCLIAFLQYLEISFFWSLRFLFGLPDDDVILQQFFSLNKAAGLSYYSVQLGYHISISFPLLLLKIYHSGKTFLGKTYNFILLSCFVLGIIALESISVFITTTICMTIYIIKTQKRLARLFMFSSLLSLIIFLISINQLARVSNIFTDTSALSRVGLFYMGSKILYENPLGLTDSETQQKKLDIIYSEGLPKYFMKIPFHNSFLNVAVNKGLHFMLIYVMIFTYYFIKLKFFWTRNLFEIGNYGVHLFLFLSLLSFFFQTNIHNAGLPNGDIFGWFVIGSIIASLRYFNYEPVLKNQAFS